jgi:mono/diheme cytochrome c family protein
MTLTRGFIGLSALAIALGVSGFALAQDEVARGAALVERLKCGTCHSPMDNPTAYTGGESDGWHAPAFTVATPVKWTQDSLVDYLFDGWDADHGIAGGPMTKIVNDISAMAPEDDVYAIAAYVASLQGDVPVDEAADQAAREAAMALDWGSPAQPPAPTDPVLAEGARVFEARCVSCHKAGGQPTPLALTAALRAPHGGNAAFTIQNGIKPPRGSLDRTMPAQGINLTDAEFVAVMQFIRDRFSDEPAWDGVEALVQTARTTPPIQ